MRDLLDTPLTGMLTHLLKEMEERRVQDALPRGQLSLFDATAAVEEGSPPGAGPDIRQVNTRAFRS